MRSDDRTETRIADRYRLHVLVGRGGMGTVWRATDELLERQVAVKQVDLPVTVSGNERAAVRARVFREARAAARLNHTATVALYDVLEDDGTLFLVMELVAAVTLEERVRRSGPLPVAETARIGLALLEALEAAHSHGIVHRDVKPSNVLVLDDGRVKLTDFGIAAVKDDPQITGTGLVIGSPSYMAPEQAESRPASPATDLWGLGATLYFAVEGDPPFRGGGEPIAVLHAVVHEAPRPAEKAGPLQDLLLPLLSKAPDDRPRPPEIRRRLNAVLESPVPADTDVVLPDTRVARADTAALPLPADEPVPVDESTPALSPSRTAGPPGARPRRTGWAVGAALLAGLLVAAVVLLSARTGRDERGAETARPNTSATGAPADRPGAASARPGARSSGDWVPYRDEATGYTIEHPAGWQVRRLDRTRTDFRDPSSGAYLRVDWTDQPGDSPEDDWRRQAQAFAARHEGYQEIRIEPTEYRSYRAAIWEFTYVGGGTTLRAVDLGFVTGRWGFALNFQTRERDWQRLQPTFERFKSAFQPPT